MTNETLRELLRNKTIIDLETEDQDFQHGLRLMLRDSETGEVGILAIEPDFAVLPDEALLSYSYQVIQSLGPAEHLYDFSEPEPIRAGEGLFG